LQLTDPYEGLSSNQEQAKRMPSIDEMQQPFLQFLTSVICKRLKAFAGEVTGQVGVASRARKRAFVSNFNSQYRFSPAQDFSPGSEYPEVFQGNRLTNKIGLTEVDTTPLVVNPGSRLPS
jgi:hypothetical protein